MLPSRAARWATRISDAQRINRFPASPLCSLSWWFEGRSEALVAERPDTMPTQHSLREAYPGRWVLAGPQTRPTSSYCAGPTHAMMVMFMPDALQQLTGVDPGALTDRMVDAQSLLPPHWLALCETVQNLPDNAARLQHLENFLEPRWQACRPAQALPTQRYGDWAAHLAQRAALSAPGRSLRQLERRIKRWAGLPLRELRGFGRASRRFSTPSRPRRRRARSSGPMWQRAPGSRTSRTCAASRAASPATHRRRCMTASMGAKLSGSIASGCSAAQVLAWHAGPAPVSSPPCLPS